MKFKFSLCAAFSAWFIKLEFGLDKKEAESEE
jgi:hypothetical protein